MFKNLYDNFAHWFHNGRGTVYFYSDPHFNDPEMVHLRKNYIGDEEQIKRINSKIGKYDTLVVLGDVGDIEWARKIRGYKVLVMGNHDKGASNYKGIFNEVYEGALMIAPNIILSHEPVEFPFARNIHGHTHGKWDAFNMCAEFIDYTPVPLSRFIKWGFKDIPDIHREAIDGAIGRKAKKVKAKEFVKPPVKPKKPQPPKREEDAAMCVCGLDWDEETDNPCDPAYWL